MSVTSLFREEMAIAMAAALVLLLALLALRPQDRGSLRNLLMLLGVCALAEAADGLIGFMGRRAAAAVAADVASVLVGIVVIRLAAILLFRVLLPALRVRPAALMEDLATTAMVLAWAFIWLRLSGVDLASLVATSAVITAVLAFSMQETLGNVLGGILLQFDGSIRLGDWVRVEDVNGRVVQMGWRHTAVETRNRETVIVPNGWLMKNRFAILGARDDARPLWRRWVRVNVDFAAQPAEVCRVLEEAVRNAEIAGVAEEPAPSAVLMELGARFGSYALRYWLEDLAADDLTDSRVRIHLLAAIERHGMKLGAPYQEELSIKDNEEHREGVRAADRARRVAALSSVELFASLTPREREGLADHLVYAPFVAGDLVTRQGAVAHWLYLIVSGSAEIVYETPAGRQHIANLEAGAMFGERGMMMGEPRSASVVARTDLVCWRLDKAGFQAVIHERPDIASAIAKVLASRQAELEGRMKAAGGEPPPHHADIAERIRAFFGLTA